VTRKRWDDLTDDEREAAIKSLSGSHVKGSPAAAWERQRAAEEDELAQVIENHERAWADRRRRRSEQT
jgi:hypothetical protein